MPTCPEIARHPLVAAARDLERMAAGLREQAAAELVRKERLRDLAAAQTEHDRIGRIVARGAGHDLRRVDDAAATYAAKHGHNILSVALWARKAIREHKAEIRRRRNRVIVQLAAQGLTNAAIARSVGVSRRTVIRVIVSNTETRM